MIAKAPLAAGTLGLAALFFFVTRAGDPGRQSEEAGQVPARSSPDNSSADLIEVNSDAVRMPEGPGTSSKLESTIPLAETLSPEQRKRYLRAGMAEEVGITGDITDEIDEIAKEDLRKLWAKSTEKRAAGVLGLRSWTELETAVALAADSGSASLPEIETVMAEALSLADQIHEAASESMNSDFKFEKWWENDEHDSDMWKTMNSVGALRGELGFSSGASTGGRNYNVYFDSYDFPHIDSAIKSLRQRIVGLKIGTR